MLPVLIPPGLERVRGNACSAVPFLAVSRRTTCLWYEVVAFLPLLEREAVPPLAG